MAKMVVLVLSGLSDKRKIMTGLKFAKMSKDSGALEDVKVIISAQAVDIFKDQDYSIVLDELKGSVTTMVCKMNAEGAGVQDEVEASGIPLAPVGKELLTFINEGYQVVSF